MRELAGVIVCHASVVAAASAAFAPLYGNDPTKLGFIGFGIGLMTGLAVVAATYVVHGRMNRR